MLQGLDNVSSATLRPFNSDINTPRIDSYRFSMANLEGKLSLPPQPPREGGRTSIVLSGCNFRGRVSSCHEGNALLPQARKPNTPFCPPSTMFHDSPCMWDSFPGLSTLHHFPCVVNKQTGRWIPRTKGTFHLARLWHVFQNTFKGGPEGDYLGRASTPFHRTTCLGCRRAIGDIEPID